MTFLTKGRASKDTGKDTMNPMMVPPTHRSKKWSSRPPSITGKKKAMAKDMMMDMRKAKSRGSHRRLTSIISRTAG